METFKLEKQTKITNSKIFFSLHTIFKTCQLTRSMNSTSEPNCSVVVVHNQLFNVFTHILNGLRYKNNY